jgi:hypothetical protein
MKRKTTIYLPDTLLRAMKIAAVRAGQREYQVVERALRAYLGMDLLARAGKRPPLGEKKALALAYREVHRGRRG